MDSNITITAEQCEECSRLKEFSLSSLVAQELHVSVQEGKYDGTFNIHYEGEWVCPCGYDNTTIGTCEVDA